MKKYNPMFPQCLQRQVCSTSSVLYFVAIVGFPAVLEGRQLLFLVFPRTPRADFRGSRSLKAQTLTEWTGSIKIRVTRRRIPRNNVFKCNTSMQILNFVFQQQKVCINVYWLQVLIHDIQKFVESNSALQIFHVNYQLISFFYF